MKTINNAFNGFLLIVFSIGFLFICYGSWDLLWQNKGHGTLPEATFLFFMILSVVIILTIVTLVIRKIILREKITINFWTFLPAIFYGIIYLIFAL